MVMGKQSSAEQFIVDVKRPKVDQNLKLNYSIGTGSQFIELENELMLEEELNMQVQQS